MRSRSIYKTFLTFVAITKPMNTEVSARKSRMQAPAQRVVESFLSTIGSAIDGDSKTDIHILDPRFFARVVNQGSLGLGESYMDGWWDVESLDKFIYNIIRAEQDSKIVPLSTKWLILKSKLFNYQTQILAKRVAQEHYDLSNFLYSRMLDPWMQYTCGYWRGAKDLNQAQEHKLDQICKKLDLKPGDRLLELGCGFGGLAKFAAENYGCRVTGYNISKEQVAWARNWTKGLEVEIVEQDFRQAQCHANRGAFDKAVAVGLFEHVGYKNYRTLMKVMHSCLKDSGLVLLHCIGGNQPRVTTDPWLEKYIFPGSVMPSASQMASAFEGLFVMEDWHNFSVDYDLTLVAWFQNFDSHWDEIKSRGYDDRFYRMWKYYLLLCAATFRARKNQNWEVVLSKRGVESGYLSTR